MSLPRFCLTVPLALAFVLLSSPGHADPEVVVIGATPGGVMAAVEAARLGHQVVLAEYEDHIGGIVSNGLTNADIGKKQAVAGIYTEFRNRVVKHYQEFDRDTPAAPNLKACRDGYFVEAHVAERIFNDMVREQRDGIQVRLRHELKQAIVEHNRLVAVILEDLAHPGRLVKLSAKAFVDATYEGDLAAMAGAPYRTGREARTEFNEPHAGRIYLPFRTTEPQPGSTGESDNATEAYCFRFHVTKDPANRVPIEKPQGFNRDDYPFALADIRAGKVTRVRQIIQLIAMPNSKYELNSDHPNPKTGVPAESLDLAEDNWTWPEATPAERRKLYDRYLTHNTGLLWLLQNDPEVPAELRAEASEYGWCRDEWPDHGHTPRQVYVRQGRRIEGEYMLTQRDADLDPAFGRTRIQPTSIGIVEWAFDSHGCHKYDPAHPGVREGYTMITHEPFQIPYGVLVPRGIDGLLVPVACSCSHVAYNALRMEPVFMALGQASAIAAHLAITGNVALRHVPTAQLQHQLVERGGVVTFYHDLKFDAPLFAAFQWLGARGLNPGYTADPKLKLTRCDASARLARILRFEGKTWAEPRDNPQTDLSSQDLADWLAQAGYQVRLAEFRATGDNGLTLGQFATLVYHTLAP
jgi:hypothetical protein